MPIKEYQFYELTNAICSVCYIKLEAKIIIESDKVFMTKNCPEHGFQKVLVSTDVSYFLKCRAVLKSGQTPFHFNTLTERGCPYDCGLCPDHEQHSCVGIIEITDKCNLECPVCYAESSPKQTKSRTIEEVDFLLESLIRNEIEPDVVQISGGEPTIHPEFFDILRLAKSKPIKHLMVNTNGLTIARSPDFCKKLKEFCPGFEIYLQFDSLQDKPYKELRGENLLSLKLKAIENLNKNNISTNLVVTVKKGTNDHEMGDLIKFAMEQECVRGITFQPIQNAGRVKDYSPIEDRLTLSEIRQNIIKQQELFVADDILPVPCHPDCIAMAYALKYQGKMVPLTRMIDMKTLIQATENNITMEKTQELRQYFFDLFSASVPPMKMTEKLFQLLCCIPKMQTPKNLAYDNLFRIIIMQFMDAETLDMRSVKKTCVHIVHHDGRVIPFDTYNLLYRNGKSIPSVKSFERMK